MVVMYAWYLFVCLFFWRGGCVFHFPMVFLFFFFIHGDNRGLSLLWFFFPSSLIGELLCAAKKLTLSSQWQAGQWARWLTVNLCEPSVLGRPWRRANSYAATSFEIKMTSPPNLQLHHPSTPVEVTRLMKALCTPWTQPPCFLFWSCLRKWFCRLVLIWEENDEAIRPHFDLLWLI